MKQSPKCSEWNMTLCNWLPDSCENETEKREMSVYVVSWEDTGDSREVDSVFCTEEDAQKRVEDLLNLEWVDTARYDKLILNMNFPIHKEKIEKTHLEKHDIPEKDLRVDTYRVNGSGVNTTDTAVRITHIPTGVIASADEARSHYANFTIAMNRLEKLLYDSQNDNTNGNTPE